MGGRHSSSKLGLRRPAALASIVALLFACASIEPLPQSSAPAPVGPLPPLEPQTVSNPDATPRPAMLRLLEGTRFTLQVLNADLPSLLLGLGRDGPLNVVVEPGVVGKVTADLRDASLREILDELVVARGYRYEVGGRVLRIYHTDRETQTFRLDYPSYSRTGSAELTLAGFIGAPSVSDEGQNSGGSDDTSLSSVTTTQTLDLWTEVERALRTIVFGSPDVTEDPAAAGANGEESATPNLPLRRVFASRQSGLLTVTADPGALEQVRLYLAEVDESLSRQVLIDAQFLEVTLSDDLDLGVDLEAAPNLGDLTGTFTRSIVPGLREAALVQSLAPLLTGGGVEFGIANDDFGAIVRALATQTDVRVVSTPRITTLNNHKALIKVVRNEVFFIAEVETNITEGIVQTTTDFTPKIVPVGVTLDVTPHVSANREITLHVRPSVSEIVSVEPQPSSDPRLPQNGSLPVVDLRETDSVLSVTDGTTIVIGGLVRSREFEQERRVPFLGDLPLIGNLFKRTLTEERRTELLIFLRPTILDRPRVVQVASEFEKRIERFDELRHERSLTWPWWRQPVGRSYGDRP